jgi:hypothetical protein
MFMASDTHSPDPKKLLISTPGVADINDSKQTLASTAPGGFVRNIPAHDFLKELLDATRQQVQANGTLQVLVIEAHGDSKRMDAERNSSDPSTETSLQAFLEGVKNLQKELGQKVANRIVLESCLVMTDLNSGDVQRLRDTAKALGTDIVGARSIRYGADIQSAQMVRFGADGSVSRDELTTTGLRPLIEKAIDTWLFSKNNRHNSDTWASCHIGQTQEAGAACQKETTLKNYQDAEFSKLFVQTGAESIYVPGGMPDKLKLSSLGALGWYSIINQLGSSVKLERAQETMTALAMSNYKGANKFYDAAAVEAHARFIDGLSSEVRQLAERYVDEYRQQHLPIPQARADSRDTKQLKTTEAAAASTPVANTNDAAPSASNSTSTTYQRGAQL